MTLKEKWLDVPDYEGLYKVSNFGKIYSYYMDIIRTPFINYGYEVMTLIKNKKPRYIRVHRIVMLAFVGKSKLTVNHIDGNKRNNRIDNLEYMTLGENIRHSYSIGIRRGRKGELSYVSKLTDKQVLEIKNLIELGVTNKTISEKFKVDPSAISHIKRGARWTHI